MTPEDAIHRAWLILAFGIALLIATAFQIATGYTPRALARTAFELIGREKEPAMFWFSMIVWAGLGLFCVGLALSRLIPMRALSL